MDTADSAQRQGTKTSGCTCVIWQRKRVLICIARNLAHFLSAKGFKLSPTVFAVWSMTLSVTYLVSVDVDTSIG